MWKKQTFDAHRQGGIWWYVEERDCCKILVTNTLATTTHETAFKIFIAARQSFHKTKVASVLSLKLIY